MTSYPTPAFRRTALAPGILGAVVLLAGAALVGTAAFVWVLFAVSILAAIIAVYAVQAGQWWWLLGLVPVVVAWNPVVPIPFEGDGWRAMQFVAALLFTSAGALIRIPNPEDRNLKPR